MKNNDLLLLAGGLLILNEVLKPTERQAIGEASSELDNLIRYTITTETNKNKKANITRVSKKEARIIKKISEQDVTDFQHTVDAYAIKHILKQHGNPASEAARGQIAVTINDFYLIPLILQSPETVEVSVTRLGLKALVYKKKIGNIYYYVEEMRNGKKELAATSLYKRKATKK